MDYMGCLSALSICVSIGVHKDSTWQGLELKEIQR